MYMHITYLMVPCEHMYVHMINVKRNNKLFWVNMKLFRVGGPSFRSEGCIFGIFGWSVDTNAAMPCLATALHLLTTFHHQTFVRQLPALKLPCP
jgi:hypothetical protein